MDQTSKNSELDAWEVLREYLRRPSWLLTFLGLSTLVLYSGALFFGYVWDDWPQIVNSPIVRSWSDLPRAFGSDLWYHVARHQLFYRPLFVAWSMLNFSLFGLRPWGWHLTAVLAHIATTVSVFWLARKLGMEYWTAALAALIFALHPIHIEPVVWISAASDTLVALFVSLGFIAFLNSREPQRTRRVAWFTLSLFMLACALLTKEMALAFFLLVAVYAWLHPGPGRTSPGKRIVWAAIEAVPYAAVTIVYGLLRRHALAHSVGALDPTHGLVDIARTLPLVLSFYFNKLMIPIGLTGLYYTPYVVGASLTQFVLPVALLGALAIGLWYWNRREHNSTVVFSAMWLLVGLVPALYLPKFGNGDFVRDRYMYLPSIGFAILLATGLRRLPSIRNWNARAVQVTAVMLLSVGYIGASLAQQVYWASDLLVLARGESLYPDNPYTLLGLSAEYSARGANERAIELAERVAREYPDYANVQLVLAESYIRAGKTAEGRMWLQRTVALNPDFATSELGMAALAGLYGRIGDYDQAFAYCDEVLRREPNLYPALYNCGNVHLMARQYQQAEHLLAAAAAIDPQSVEAKYYLARALLEEGQYAEAGKYLDAVVRVEPNGWTYHYWLGWALEEGGNIPAARQEYQRALQLNPDSAEARARLTEVATK